jgi:peptidoglycan/LPS O-acetylase OafA/YrhL
VKHLRGIDGLRAIAVLAVVAYHAGLPVPAGFVGVDVFFVISGFLITKLLHDEVQAAGRIDFLAFYARRARRILPALVVVVTATLAASALLLPEPAETLRSAAAAFLFAANLFFAAQPSGYFDPSPDTQPLLHLWSLGVEEQFYLAWPVVLILARRKPVAALVTIAALSFIAAETWLVSGDTQAAFYLMPARAWELALGGLVALRPMRLPRGSAWVALLVTLGACMVPLADFPGTGALPAVIASALLVAAIQSGDRCALLESRPMVWTGLISYSLYLWHWPVLLFGRMWGVPDLALVVLAFVLATVSYRAVETPARRAPHQPRREVATAFAVVVVGCMGLLMLPKPLPATPLPSIYAMGCDDWYKSDVVKPCAFGPSTGKTLVVMGDSVGLQWFPALSKIYKGWRIVVLTKSSCAMVDAPFYYPRLHREYTECATWRTNALKEVAAMKPDLVIFGSTYEYELTQAQWTDGTRRVLQSLPGEVRILRPTPVRGDTSDQRANVNRWLDEAVQGRSNVRLVDVEDLACPHRRCDPSDFRDREHLTETYVSSLTAPLASRLR